MKKIIPSLLLFFTSGICAQTIENLKSFREVATFLEKKVNKEYTFEAIFEGEDEIDTEDFNEDIRKVDLDNNGTIDLVVDYIGDMIVVLNKGNDTYEEIKMMESVNFYKLQTTYIQRTNGQTFFIRKTELYHHHSNEEIIVDEGDQKGLQEQSENDTIQIETFEVKFGAFLLVNKKNTEVKNKIKEIHFETTPCYGSCPVFELKLTSDGVLDYFGKKNTNFKGRKKRKLDPQKVEELFGLIEYVNVKSLKDRYYINETDNPSANLKVVFKNGEIKEIYDYGLSGTYNLRVIYNKLKQISNEIK